MGFSDEQICRIMNDGNDRALYEKRKAAGITRVYKMVDTCAAEFEAKTPYFYSTFENGLANESIVSEKKKIIVLGSGPNRIGQGIEFDYCCVHGLLAIKECGYEAIMVNCNPETVSTDFDIADKLYFEPVYWEHLWEIVELEKPVRRHRSAWWTNRPQARRTPAQQRHQDHWHFLRQHGHRRRPGTIQRHAEGT